MGTFECNNYSLGMNSFLGNDVVPTRSGGSNYWRIAQDARITSLGEYETRKGFDNYTVQLQSVGAANIVAQLTGGSVDEPVGGATWYADQFTTTGVALRVTQVGVRMKNSTGTGVPIVEIWSNSAGLPGTMLTRSSVDPATITGAYTSVVANFAKAVLLDASTVYWVVFYVQSGGTNTYNIQASTATTTALSSANQGAAWSATTYSLRLSVNGATQTPTIGLHEAVRSDGTTKVIVASSGAVAYVNDVTSSPTSINSGLNVSATAYRFITVNDIVYYVNSFDGYRKWDFTTESQVSATNYSNIALHKGIVFLVDVAEPNKLVYSNFGLYDTFTSTDFILVPAPKTGDPITGILSLNGYLLIFTRNNKYILSGDNNSNFSLSEAPDQKGSFTQETITADQNFTYYLSDDGVYRSNGSEAQLISQNNYQDILDIASKDKCCIAVNRGRLYLWYPSAGSAYNDSCWVWNLNYDSKSQTVESNDTNAYVARAVSGASTTSPLIVGSSFTGSVYWQELATNDYNNLGGDINFRLQTHFMHFGTPGVLKQVRRWLFRSGAQSANYAITPEYAYDLRSSFQSIGDENVQGSGTLWGAGALWGSFTWGTNVEWQFTKVVPGEYRRFAFAYKHFAARQPETFLGHTIVYETRRMR